MYKDLQSIIQNWTDLTRSLEKINYFFMSTLNQLNFPFLKLGIKDLKYSCKLFIIHKLFSKYIKLLINYLVYDIHMQIYQKQ